MTETASLATLVLPAKGPFEKSGTRLNFAGDLLPVNASIAAPEFARSDFEMLAGLAQELVVNLPSPDDLHRIVVTLAAGRRALDFTLGDPRFAFRGEDDRERTAPERPILSGGGTWLHDPLVAGLRP